PSRGPSDASRDRLRKAGDLCGELQQQSISRVAPELRNQTPGATAGFGPLVSHAEVFAGTKVAIVGGTGGLGRALSRLMASRGASVIVVGQTFRDSDVPGIELIKADLSAPRLG